MTAKKLHIFVYKQPKQQHNVAENAVYIGKINTDALMFCDCYFLQFLHATGECNKNIVDIKKVHVNLLRVLSFQPLLLVPAFSLLPFLFLLFLAFSVQAAFSC